jgi:hypothetical protein
MLLTVHVLQVLAKSVDGSGLGVAGLTLFFKQTRKLGKMELNFLQ